MEVAPSEDSEAFIRPRRRLDIEQLDRAIQQVTGGIAWTDGEGAEATNLFESLESTLGVPDYLRTVQEDLDPGAVFQKFLGDAARSVCTRLVASELEAAAEDRVLIAHVEPEDTVGSAPESVDQNLRYLMLRYHGRHVPPTDPSLQRWRWLFDKTSEVSEDPMQGWRAVCIGLITHPHFYSY